LQGQVAKRNACVDNLEHALAILAINGERPKHKDIKKAIKDYFTVGADFSLGRRENSQVDSIDYYSEELNELNRVINDTINEIEKKQRPQYGKYGGRSGRNSRMTSNYKSSLFSCCRQKSSLRFSRK
jgi:hypothetical protein